MHLNQSVSLKVETVQSFKMSEHLTTIQCRRPHCKLFLPFTNLYVFLHQVTEELCLLYLASYTPERYLKYMIEMADILLMRVASVNLCMRAGVVENVS